MQQSYLVCNKPTYFAAVIHRFYATKLLTLKMGYVLLQQSYLLCNIATYFADLSTGFLQQSYLLRK